MTKDELKAMILADAKAEGLEVAEDAAEKLVRFSLRTIDSIVLYSENKIDDVVWAAVKAPATEIALDLVDGINGKEG